MMPSCSWSVIFFFSSRRRHTRCSRDWSSDVCSSDLIVGSLAALLAEAYRQSRNRLAMLYAELERAHDESLKLNVEMQGAARRFVLTEVEIGRASCRERV